MKKRLPILLVVIISIIACAFCACNKPEPDAPPPADEEKPIVLVDFPTTATEEVLLGSEYRLKIKKVKDKSGKEYNVSASVTDSKSAEVALNNGDAFRVTDIDGYTVVYTAETGKTPQTQTLTLTVKDEEKPTVVIDDPKDGTVGEEYTLPEITFSDLSGKISTSSVTLYYVGDTDEKVDFTEEAGARKFTPNKTGEYSVVAYAKDEAGNERTDRKNFTVDIAMAENVIYSPASIEAKERLTADTEIKTEIVTAGSGSPYISFSRNEDAGVWVNLRVRPVYELSHYESYDYITVPVYVNAEAVTNGGNVRIGFFNDENYRRLVKVGEWVNVNLPMERFIAEMNGADNFIPLNFNNSASANHKNLTEVRIGEITAGKFGDSASHMILDTSDAAAVMQFAPTGSAAEIEDTSVAYVPASGGERAYFEFRKATETTEAGAWRHVKMNSRYSSYSYTDDDYVSIWLRADNQTRSEISIGLFGKNTGVFGQTFATNTWKEILLPANVFFDELATASYCFYANFSTGGSQSGLTALRIGDIAVKRRLSVSVDKGNDLNASEESRNVNITVVSTDGQARNYTLILTDGSGTTVDGTANGNVHTYSLPTGAYTYTLATDDDRYVIPVASGIFTIEYMLDVKVQTVNQNSSSKGSATVTATFDGEVSEFTLEVKNSADETMPVTLDGKTFTVGNLKAGFYTYTLTVGYIVKTGNINIGYDVAEYMLFDPNKPDSVGQWTPNKVTLTQVDATDTERAYLNVTGSGWTSAQLSTFCRNDYVYDETDVVSMWLYLDTTDDVEVKIGIFNSFDYRQFFRSNQWYEVIIPANVFFERIKNDTLLPEKFKDAKSAMHANLQNIRVGEISVKKQAVIVDSSALYTLSDDETERDVTINVTNNFATVTHTFTLKDASGVTVQPVSSQTTGNVTAYTYRLQKGAYTYTVSAVDSAQGEQRYVLGFLEKFRYLDGKNWYVVTRFASEITESVQVGNEYILVSAEESNYEVNNGGKLSSGTETSLGSAYTGNYVKAEKNAGGKRWPNPKFKTALPLYNAYAEFDYIVIWVYEESDTADSTTNQAFFNTASVVGGYNTKPKLKNNVWHKITFSVSFLLDNALLAANNSFAATALFMNFDPVLPDGTVTNAADFPATKAVRIGNIYLEKAADANI